MPREQTMMTDDLTNLHTKFDALQATFIDMLAELKVMSQYSSHLPLIADNVKQILDRKPSSDKQLNWSDKQLNWSNVKKIWSTPNNCPVEDELDLGVSKGNISIVNKSPIPRGNLPPEH